MVLLTKPDRGRLASSILYLSWNTPLAHGFGFQKEVISQLQLIQKARCPISLRCDCLAGKHGRTLVHSSSKLLGWRKLGTSCLSPARSMLVPVASLPLDRPPFWAVPYHFCPNSEMQLRCKWLRFPFQVHFFPAACGKHWKNSKLLSGTWIHAVSWQCEHSRTSEYSDWNSPPERTNHTCCLKPWSCCYGQVWTHWALFHLSGAWPVPCSCRKGRAVCLWRVSFPHNSLGWQEIFS